MLFKTRSLNEYIDTETTKESYAKRFDVQPQGATPRVYTSSEV